jgi:hypothetical protein
LVSFEEALMDLAVRASERPLIVNLFQIGILNPIEVIIRSSPRHHDGVGAAVVPHVALDLGGRILDHCELGEMRVGLAEDAGPALDLLVGAVRDHGVFGLENRLFLVVG